MRLGFSTRAVSRSLVLLTTSSVLCFFGISPVHASEADAAAKLKAILATTAGKNLVNQANTLLQDTAFPRAVAKVLQDDGPSGRNPLTSYQAQILQTGLTLTLDDADLIAATVNGKALTKAQQQEKSDLQKELSADPAVQSLTKEGAALQKDLKSLTADIDADADADASVPALSTEGRADDPALDTFFTDLNKTTASSAFANTEKQLKPVVESADYDAYAADTSKVTPLQAAVYLPASELGSQTATTNATERSATAQSTAQRAAAQRAAAPPVDCGKAIGGLVGVIVSWILIVVGVVLAPVTAGATLLAMFVGIAGLGVSWNFYKGYTC